MNGQNKNTVIEPSDLPGADRVHQILGEIEAEQERNREGLPPKEALAKFLQKVALVVVNGGDKHRPESMKGYKGIPEKILPNKALEYLRYATEVFKHLKFPQKGRVYVDYSSDPAEQAIHRDSTGRIAVAVDISQELATLAAQKHEAWAEVTIAGEIPGQGQEIRTLVAGERGMLEIKNEEYIEIATDNITCILPGYLWKNTSMHLADIHALGHEEGLFHKPKREIGEKNNSDSAIRSLRTIEARLKPEPGKVGSKLCTVAAITILPVTPLGSEDSNIGRKKAVKLVEVLPIASADEDGRVRDVDFEGMCDFIDRWGEMPLKDVFQQEEVIFEIQRRYQLPTKDHPIIKAYQDKFKDDTKTLAARVVGAPGGVEIRDTLGMFFKRWTDNKLYHGYQEQFRKLTNCAPDLVWEAIKLFYPRGEKGAEFFAINEEQLVHLLQTNISEVGDRVFTKGGMNGEEEDMELMDLGTTIEDVMFQDTSEDLTIVVVRH